MILLIAQQIESWVGTVNALFPMINKQHILFMVMFFKTLLLLTSGIILIPLFGMIGGGFTVLLSSVLYIIGIKLYVEKRLKLKFAPMPFIRYEK